MKTEEGMSAEKFIREKIREKQEIKGKMYALWKYQVSGEDCLRWAHEYASQFKYDYSQSCKCEENTGSTWCCNICGLPENNESKARKSQAKEQECVEFSEWLKQETNKGNLDIVLSNITELYKLFKSPKI